MQYLATSETYLLGHQCCAVATASAVVIDPGGRCHVLATVWSCAWVGQAIGLWRSTGGIMANVVNDFLLFSCLAAFVTGIVLAAASLLI
jgi:hypothetical protein